MKYDEYDVVVIGAGLSGLFAAHACALRRKRAVVLGTGLGTVYSASGIVNILGWYPLDSRNAVQRPLDALESLIREHPGHPYARVGRGKVEEALSLFLAACTEMHLPYGGSLLENTLLPTSIGTLSPVTLYPATAPVDVHGAASLTVVGFHGYPDFVPAYVAGNLERRLGRAVRHVRIDAAAAGKTVNSFDLAAQIERGALAVGIAGQLKGSVEAGGLAIFPAVLGLLRHEEIVRALERELGCRVLEVPTLPPSVAGYRLAESLKKRLAARGVEVITGAPVTSVDVSDGACRAVGVSGASGRLQRYAAPAYVLATGGILGEGLRVEPGGIRETVFALPVSCDDPVCQREFLDLKGHAVFRAGVAVNDRLQPLGGDGKVALRNVYVAGATLAGFDPIAERNGHAVGIVTGYKAGILASGGGD